MDEERNLDEKFTPVGTAWILAIYFLLIIAFWGLAYLEMLLGA